jgi:Na+/proline symporter
VQKLFEEPYTIFSAVIASTFLTMATHGTDQDNVQRMLTAKDFRKSRLSLILSGLADLPIAFGFLLVGILLSVYYQVRPDPHLPAADNEIFAYYIVTQMPVGIRGLIIAGVFATMMGSTSAALNALATSFTKDFYLPYFRRRDSAQSPIYAARAATVVFGALMVVVATLAAYAVLQDSKLTIIPLALQSFGYAYGSLLAVFLLGMLTKRRGRDETNVLAMLLGVASVLVLCKVRLPAVDLGELVLGGRLRPQDWAFGGWLPAWWPVIAFPWWVLVGCLVCFTVSCFFATPIERVQKAEKRGIDDDRQAL